MEFQIRSTRYYETKDLVKKYGEILSPYHLKIKNDTAYIKVTSVQNLVNLYKNVGEIIIGGDDSLFIEIYDDYRE